MPSAPGFGDAALLSTLNTYPFAGIDSGLSDEERFARGVAQAVRAWLRSHAAQSGSHSVFLLEPTLPEHLNELPHDTYFALDDGETDITNGMWFVGPPVVRGTRADTAATFDAMFPAVVDAGLGDRTAVTYRMTNSGAVLRYYPQGLAEPEQVVSMALSNGLVDLKKVFEVIDIVHTSTLVTPSGHQGGAKLWKNRAKYYPVKHVEVEIQAYLRTGLQVGLPLCRINPEQNLVAGRLDLEIEEYDLDTQKWAKHAILELKVIRSYGSTGVSTSKAQTEKWIEEGVEQAQAYRDERKARESALCCFDMRLNAGAQDCVEKVKTKAQGLKVEVKTWPLYPDTKVYRAAGASAALSKGSQPATT